MKITTWMDRLYASLWGIALAQVLGPETLAVWMMALAVVWIASPWPETTIKTRLLLGFSSLSITMGVIKLWPWAAQRPVLIFLIVAGLWSFRMLNALPVPHALRLSMTLAGLTASGLVLFFSRSLMAGLWTGLAFGLSGTVMGLWKSRQHWGRLEIPRLDMVMTSIITAGLQMQILFWLHAADISPASLGAVCAALLTLEMVKIGLVALTMRYDVALARFSPTRESFLETIRSLSVYGLLVMCPTVLLVYFGADRLVDTLYGSSFSEAILWLRILIWGFVFGFFNVLGSRILQLKQAEDSIRRARLAQAGLEAVMAFIWIPTLGIEGACFARVLGEALGFVIIAIHVNRVVPGLINPFRRTFG